jgi:aminoglycoside/choline kinase family phosphotransferase
MHHMIAPEDLPGSLCRLAAEVTGERPSSFSATKLKGDASSRSYYRLRGGTSSLIAMVLPAEAGKSEEATQPRTTTETELPFLNVHRYLALGGTPVPAIHRVELALGVILLEDLGDVTLEIALQGGGAREREALYTDAMELLVGMRLHGESHPDPGCIAFGRAFDRTLYRWELDHYLEYGFVARTGQPPSPMAARVMARAFDGLADRLAAEPRGFTHRDYQSRNLMRGRRGFTVIDFQDALLGPRQYDLVALLRDSYVELPEGLVDALLGRYVEDVSARTGEAIDADAFRKTFDLCTVQRKLKDAGRFEFIDRVKKNPSFLPYIAPSLRYVARALERLPEHSELLSVLRDVHPEMSLGPAPFAERSP